MSHEIRTPMNAIIGLGELASGQTDDADFIRECLAKSKSASKYLLSVLNDILDMSKIESGKIELEQRPFAVCGLIEKTLEIIKPLAEERGVSLREERTDLDAVILVGDETRMQQVLVNLLNNATKFTPVGGLIRLATSVLLDEGGATASIRFVVSDTGIGMTPEFLGRLFDPFAQEHSGMTNAYAGSGLGLPIARNLARQMGGDIVVQSMPGEGSTFTAWMKLATAAAVDGIDSVQPKRIGSIDLSSKRILLVEDHPLNRMVAVKLLETQGAEVLCAENGFEGVAAFKRSEPGSLDAILMDIRMPVMDGLEATRAIRALATEYARDVPIIAMTANAYREDVEKSLAAGMNDHLAKPIEPEVLYAALACLWEDVNSRGKER